MIYNLFLKGKETATSGQYNAVNVAKSVPSSSSVYGLAESR
jgi:hypothetical protein